MKTAGLMIGSSGFSRTGRGRGLYLSRSLARETAFKVLFQVDLAGASPKDALEYLTAETPLVDRYLAFARELIDKTLEHVKSIDGLISKYSPEWSISRMATVDRNILRMAVCEMLYTEIDPVVVINEAVELAKKYGDENSSSFINAILDRIMGEKSEGFCRD